MQQVLESAALERLNPALPPEAITAAMDELTLDPVVAGLPKVALASAVQVKQNADSK